VQLGRITVFTIRVRNGGTVAATNVRICDRIPARAVFVRAKGGSFAKGQYCWTVSRIAPGTTAGVQIAMRAVGVGIIRNVATATSSQTPTIRARANVRVTDLRGAARVPSVTG
jgi:uncharacterized repeat protein (TIGR01451 family)